MPIFNRVKEVRGTAGLSQGDLAQLVGLSQPALSQIERGHRAAWPRIRRQLSEALGTSEVELFPPLTPEEDLFSAALECMLSLRGLEEDSSRDDEETAE